MSFRYIFVVISLSLSMYMLKKIWQICNIMKSLFVISHSLISHHTDSFLQSKRICLITIKTKLSFSSCFSSNDCKMIFKMKTLV